MGDSENIRMKSGVAQRVSALEALLGEVQYVHRNGSVTAVWIGDEELRKNPRKVLENPELFFRDDVEIIAEATRYYQSDGSAFSGWVVSTSGSYSDPIPNKELMLEQLKYVVSEIMPTCGAMDVDDWDACGMCRDCSSQRSSHD